MLIISKAEEESSSPLCLVRHTLSFINFSLKKKKTQQSKMTGISFKQVATHAVYLWAAVSVPFAVYQYNSGKSMESKAATTMMMMNNNNENASAMHQEPNPIFEQVMTLPDDAVTSSLPMIQRDVRKKGKRTAPSASGPSPGGKMSSSGGKMSTSSSDTCSCTCEEEPDCIPLYQPTPAPTEYSPSRSTMSSKKSSGKGMMRGDGPSPSRRELKGMMKSGGTGPSASGGKMSSKKSSSSAAPVSHLIHE